MSDNERSSSPARLPDCDLPRLEVDIVLEAGDWDGVLSDGPALAEAAVRAGFAFGLAQTEASGESPLPEHAEVCVVLNDDAGVHALNRRWRAKDRPTNVLSFPAMSDAELMEGMAWVLGDIVLALETVVREAREQGKTLDAHFSHLLVHGMLHLLGFDHETPDEAERMEPLEVAALASLGIADPYPPGDEG